MNAAVISVGTELTTGQTLDTNARWLSEALTARGISVVRHATVDDHRERVGGAIREALESAELVVMSGGLGPTADDVTRDALADALGSPLVQSDEAMAEISAFFARLKRRMTDADTVQAQIPQGCEILHNSCGTAPGIHYCEGDRRLFALPGVPSEMRAMFREEVARHLPPASVAGCTQLAVLHCFGMSEAKLGAAIADRMTRDHGPQVGTTAKGSVIGVRIVATGATPAAAAELLDDEKAAIRGLLGDIVFGEDEDTLESVVAGLLIARSKTVATAESCTGGLIAKRLTDVPGSSGFFERGYVTYADRAKTELLGVSPESLANHGAVSEPVVEAMALGCRTAAGTDFALAVSGIAGPGGDSPEKPVGLVVIGLADDAGADVRRYLLGSHLTRTEVRDRSCKIALNLLRLRLLRDPQ